MLLGLGPDERPVEKISGPVQDSFIQNCRPRVPDTLRCVKPSPLLECILFRNLVQGDELYRCRVLLKYIVGSHEPPILMLFWPYRYPAHLPRAAKNPLSVLGASAAPRGRFPRGGDGWEGGSSIAKRTPEKARQVPLIKMKITVPCKKTHEKSDGIDFIR